MENNDKYHELDKQITAEIMKEFKGVVVVHECPTCKGKPVKGYVCPDCENKGYYSIEY